MSSSTEELIKQELGTNLLTNTGKGGGGCISEGTVYDTDFGKVFIKFNGKSDALQMFTGEYHGLKALNLTETVKVPKPIKVIKNPKGGGILVMEYVDFGGLRKHTAKLGELLARLHLHNTSLKSRSEKSQQSVHSSRHDIEGKVAVARDELENEQCNQYVSGFGFPVTTCCGYLPQDNTWMDSWVDFYVRKIDQNVKFAQEKFGDREVGQVWSSLLPHIPKLFEDVTIEPALLHGDLWGGNAGETNNEPVIFDPASMYGHSEFDLSISTMFGGFGKAYFQAYHSFIPKQKGFDDRQDLYCMFHYLNHWNHFGGGYKSSTMSLLRGLVKRFK